MANPRISNESAPQFPYVSATPLSGRVAIVTGAGRHRGIGRASALVLARMGADVVITGTGRDPANYPDDEKEIGWRDIDSLADEITGLGRRALPLVVDVTDPEAVDELVASAVSEFGRADILVNNAAAPMAARLARNCRREGPSGANGTTFPRRPVATFLIDVPQLLP